MDEHPEQEIEQKNSLDDKLSSAILISVTRGTQRNHWTYNDDDDDDDVADEAADVDDADAKIPTTIFTQFISIKN